MANLDLNQSLNKLQQQEHAKNMVRQQHLQLTFQIYAESLSNTDDPVEMERLCERALTASTIMFQKVGLIKGN